MSFIMQERQRFKEEVILKAERDREFRLKKIEKDHNDSEILLVRTRSQAKQAVYKEVKNTTGYLEIIKKPTDFTMNISVTGPPKRKVVDNFNATIKDPEDPTTSNEDEDAVATKDVMDSATSSNAQVVEKNIVENVKDSSTKNSTDIDIMTTETKDEDLLGDVIVANTLNGAADTFASEDMSVRSDKHPSKNERNERSKKVAMSRRRDDSSLKMDISSILTDEIPTEVETESVGQRSELSKMAISNILSSESPDVVQTDNKYSDESETDNGNNEHAGPMFVQYGSGSVVSYEFDTIVQKSNNNNNASKENEKVVPNAVVKDDSQKSSNTPNDSKDTIRTPWAPAFKKNRKKKTTEVNDGDSNESKNKRAFVPNAETIIKLEWSLNHPVFKLDEEIFGESTDTDISDCCSDCAIEVD